MKKKVLSLLLSLAMVACMMPAMTFTAFAGSLTCTISATADNAADAYFMHNSNKKATIEISGSVDKKDVFVYYKIDNGNLKVKVAKDSSNGTENTISPCTRYHFESIKEDGDELTATTYTKIGITANKNRTITIKVAPNKQKATITTDPTKVDNLVYSGQAQALLNNNGVASTSLEYKLTGPSNDWSDNIPTGINAGEYTVLYRAKETAEYAASDSKSIGVTIAKKPITVKVNDVTLKVGSEAPRAYAYKVNGLVDDSHLTDLFKTGKTPVFGCYNPNMNVVNTVGYAINCWNKDNIKLNNSNYSLDKTTGIVSGKLYVVIDAVKVTFNMNGHGDAVAPLEGLAPGTTIDAPAEPKAEGFEFGGWFKEAACTNAWDFAKDVVLADTTLYAKWTAVEPTPEVQEDSITAPALTKKYYNKKGKLIKSYSFKINDTAVSGRAITFKKLSGNKKITVSSTGKVTVKKGLKVGTYKLKVKESVGANEEWTAATATKTITVKVTRKK